MSPTTREAKLSRAFVTLADTLVADFDLVDLLQTLVETCTDLLETEAGGLLLRSSDGQLQVVTSTTDDANFVEVAQLSASAGPCWDCAVTGVAVTVGDIAETGDRWPAFREAALERGFRSVHATPLRLRDEVIGTMNLFDTRIGALGEQDIAAAQALSDVATIGILSERLVKERGAVAAQLQHALDSRIVIEQAKGILAQSSGVSVDGAFTALRAFARGRGLNIHAVASTLVEGGLDPAEIVQGIPRRRPPAASA